MMNDDNYEKDNKQYGQIQIKEHSMRDEVKSLFTSNT